MSVSHVRTNGLLMPFQKSRKRINIPLVVDIHFDYKLALKAIEGGADKIRINPGIFGKREKVEAVVKNRASWKGIVNLYRCSMQDPLKKELSKSMVILLLMVWSRVHFIILKS